MTDRIRFVNLKTTIENKISLSNAFTGDFHRIHDTLQCFRTDPGLSARTLS